jgi:hypothetical protein
MIPSYRRLTNWTRNTMPSSFPFGSKKLNGEAEEEAESNE